MRSRILLLILAGIAGAYLWSLYQGRRGLQAGDEAPPFTLPSDGKEVSLADYRGTAVLLNFWATWCPPCVAEIPSLNRLLEMNVGFPLAILAVSVDDHWEEVNRFRERVPLRMPVLLDASGELASLYGVRQLPVSYLLDGEGKVVKKYLGPREWDEEELVSEIRLTVP